MLRCISTTPCHSDMSSSPSRAILFTCKILRLDGHLYPWHHGPSLLHVSSSWLTTSCGSSTSHILLKRLVNDQEVFIEDREPSMLLALQILRLSSVYASGLHHYSYSWAWVQATTRYLWTSVSGEPYTLLQQLILIRSHSECRGTQYTVDNDPSNYSTTKRLSV